MIDQVMTTDIIMTHLIEGKRGVTNAGHLRNVIINTIIDQEREVGAHREKRDLITAIIIIIITASQRRNYHVHRQ